MGDVHCAYLRKNGFLTHKSGVNVRGGGSARVCADAVMRLRVYVGECALHARHRRHLACKHGHELRAGERGGRAGGERGQRRFGGLGEDAGGVLLQLGEGEVGGGLRSVVDGN